jgi:hypothetical protein
MVSISIELTDKELALGEGSTTLDLYALRVILDEESTVDIAEV